MMIKNPVLKNILSVLAVLVFGFVLLNLAFVLAALVSSFYDRILHFNQEMGFSTIYFVIRGGTFVVILGILSWLIFTSKLTTIYKAIYATVPAAVVLVFIGIGFYRWPVAAYSLGALISLGSLAWLYFTKKPWLYYVSVLFVSLALLIMSLLGIDI